MASSDLKNEALDYTEYGYDAYGMLRNLLNYADDEAVRKLIKHYEDLKDDK